MPASDATSRFSDRVQNYALYRPGYPVEALQTLQTECGFAAYHVVADIASGTGIWTRRLLENGNRVFGVEPNAEMRKAGELFLQAFPNFTSVPGTAEATTLADESVDFVTVAQAAHWFHREAARREFVRILKPGGWLALIWNERVTDSTQFLRAYEQLLLTFGTDYTEVRHERTTDGVTSSSIRLRSRSDYFRRVRNSITLGLKGDFCLHPTRRDRIISNTRRCWESCNASLTPLP